MTELPRRLGWWERAASAGGRLLKTPPPPGGHRSEIAINRPPSPVQRMSAGWRESGYLNRLDEGILRPRLSACATIAVVSPKGGVGKTTISALLGMLLARLRNDRVLAVDCNPDFGSLGRSLVPHHMVFVDELLDVLDKRDLTVTGLDSTLGRAGHGLMVLPAPADPARMARLGEDAYRKLIQRLQELVGIMVLDCGTGLQDPAVRAALAGADQVVLVSDADPATAGLVADAAELLAEQEAGVPLLLAVNKLPRKGSRLNVEAFAASVPNASGLVVLPEAGEAAARLSSGRFDWEEAPYGWQVAVRELALSLILQWPALGLAQPSPSV